MADSNRPLALPYLPPHIVSTPVVLVEELLAQAYLEKARQWAAASSEHLQGAAEPPPSAP